MTASVVGHSALTALRASSCRVAEGPIRVRCLGTTTGEPRLAFAIGRHFGNAVERNRARRRLQAAISAAERQGLASSEPVSADLLISCSRAVLDISFNDLVNHSERLLVRLESACA